MKTVVLFDSMGGNTEKVARTIHETVEAEWGASTLIKVDKETKLDVYDYDLVFVGSPVIEWLPTKKLMDYVRRTMKGYNEAGLIKPSSPIVPGKFGICFGTYGGPHIGKGEALPMTMWLRSFLEHLGVLVLDEWHVVGCFQNRDDLNTVGRLGDIRNRPNANDLAEVQNNVRGLLASLAAYKG